MTIEEFDFSCNPKIPAAVTRDLAALRFVEAGESDVLHGPVGVGKSHVARPFGHGACPRGHAVVFTKTRLLADLGGGHAGRACPVIRAPVISSPRRWWHGVVRPQPGGFNQVLGLDGHDK